MDQETPLHDEKTVRFADLAGSIQPYTVFRLRRTIFASSGTVRYSLSGGSGLCLLPAHDRLSSSVLRCVAVDEFLLTGGEHYRNLGARQKIRRTVGFSSCRAPRKVCMCRFGTHTIFSNQLSDPVPLPSAAPTLALVERRDPHAVPATGRRAPSTPAVLARVIEESAAAGIGTFLHAGKIATTEQGGSGFADRNEQLSRLLEVRLKSSLETPRSLDQSRGAR